MTTRKNEHASAITTYRQALLTAMKKYLMAPFFGNTAVRNAGLRGIRRWFHY